MTHIDRPALDSRRLLGLRALAGTETERAALAQQLESGAGLGPRAGEKAGDKGTVD
ncbi:hypothetical protein [Pseudoroseicyclus sp. CXY001]|uniref:hypothetical protein n=1 Tax=Pseudoroseicyclus sp. CXY001 TaxID=3242492 RepID=UPI0035713C2A